MDENLHNIDDFFKKALNEHEEMPSHDVWEQIDKNLDKKKVDFISKKYNKLKWVAAALLMFSAGMAMYTWRTRMKNKELVQQNVAAAKNKMEKYKSNKKDVANNSTAETSIPEVEKEATAKNTGIKINQNHKIDLSEKSNTANKQNVSGNNKKLREAENADAEVLKKQSAAIIAESPDKSERNPDKYKQKIKELSIRNQGNDSEKVADKEVILKDNKTALLFEEQKNIFDSNLKFPIENTRKEVNAEIEPVNHNFKISSSNSPLENFLKKTSDNNTITIKEYSIVKAKKNKSKLLKKSLFSAGLFYSPDFVSSKVDDDHHRFREDDRNEIKNKEEIRDSYTAGLLIDYNKGKKISVESGLTFSSITTAIASKQIFARPDSRGNLNYRFNCSAGYSYIPVKPGSNPVAGDSITALSSKNILQYIGVPFAVKYNVSKGKLSLNPGFGIAINFLTKGKIETGIEQLSGTEKANINNIEGLKHVYLNGSFSLSANYNLNQNLVLSFTPAARFALTSINKDAPVKTYLNSLGLAAGLFIKL